MDHFEHKIIQGEGAGKWLPFARQKVAALHTRAKAMRVTALVQRWTAEAGMVEIAVRVVGDQRYIHIRRKGCPPFLSGFIDLTGFLGACTFIIPNPTPPPDTIEVLRRFYPSPAQTEPPRAWRDDPGLIHSGPQTAGCIGTIATKASMFSSEMRKVVQVLQGMDVEIEYSYVASPTHGVFKAESGQRWIIEVSNQGVCAWAMGMCRNPILSRDNEILLDYTPIHTPKPTGDALTAAREAGTFIDLLPAAGVMDYYTKSPYFSACGWAFNGDGHEAANVCVGADSNAPVGFLYKIQITETGNRPVSATLIEADHGYLAIGTDRCHMKYPISAGRELLFSYDTGNYLPVNTNAPVYCYYDDMELLVFRVVFNSGTVTFNENEEGPCIPGCPGFTVPPNDSGGSYLVSGFYSTLEVPHFVGGSGSNPSVQAETNYAATFRTRHAAPEPIGISGVSSSQCVFNFNELYNTSGSQTTVQGAELARNVLAVPAHDREAVYIGGKLDGTPVTRTGYSMFSSLGGGTVFLPGSCAIAPGTYSTSAVEECVTSPGRCVSVSLGTTPGNPTALKVCSNGVRPYAYAACGGTLPYFPYSSVFVNGVQDGGTCVPPGGVIPTGSFTCVSFSDDTPLSIGSLSATLSYSGSGGAQGSLLPRVAQNPFETDIFQFSEFPIGLISIRDAFDGRKYIISPDQGKFLGSDCLSTATDYPVNEASAGMAFVGVP